MFASSKKLKTDKRIVSMSDALEGVKDLDVEAWRYKEGEGDGGEHIGPYAEDVQREFGDEVAPGGAGIRVEPMRAVNREATEQLAAQLSRVQKKLDLLKSGGARV